MGNKKILLGLTTTSNSDWREKIAEVKRYQIKELALFLTGIELRERRELYALLEASPAQSIPHVHLRNDMTIDELQYLTDRFKTQAFNIHPQGSRFPFTHDYGKFCDQIYVENITYIPTKEDLRRYAGLCVDFSHLEGAALHQFKNYENFWPMLEQQRIGCCHLSPFPGAGTSFEAFAESDSHWMNDVRDFDYVSKYIKYLPNLISLEIANPFADQLRAKEYLEKLINS